MPQKKVVGQH